NGVVMVTLGGVESVDPPATLLTVTVIAPDVVVLPAASRATAVSVCVPLVAIVVSHTAVNGEAVSSAPRLAPSSLNCTPTTPMLSVAVAVTVTPPETVEPLEGAVIDTVGGVVSPPPPPLPAPDGTTGVVVFLLTTMGAEIVDAPLASVPTAWIWYAASG